MLPGYFHIDQRVKSQIEMILTLYNLPLIVRVFFFYSTNNIKISYLVKIMPCHEKVDVLKDDKKTKEKTTLYNKSYTIKVPAISI